MDIDWSPFLFGIGLLTFYCLFATIFRRVHKERQEKAAELLDVAWRIRERVSTWYDSEAKISQLRDAATCEDFAYMTIGKKRKGQPGSR